MTMDDIVRRCQIAKMAADEAKVRELLGRWVSGCDPAVAYEGTEVIGLCDADVPVGTRNTFILR